VSVGIDFPRVLLFDKAAVMGSAEDAVAVCADEHQCAPIHCTIRAVAYLLIPFANSSSLLLLHHRTQSLLGSPRLRVVNS